MTVRPKTPTEEYLSTVPSEVMSATAFSSGYLSREGIFYPCGSHSHRFLAKRLFIQVYPGQDEPYNLQDFFDREGWLKLSDNTIIYFGAIYDVFLYPSPAQVRAVTEWMETKNRGSITYNLQEDISLLDFLEDTRP